MTNLNLIENEYFSLIIYLTEADGLQTKRCFDGDSLNIQGIFNYNSKEEKARDGLVRLVRFSSANKGCDFLTYEEDVSDEQILYAIEKITVYNKEFKYLFDHGKDESGKPGTQLYLQIAYKLKEEKESSKSHTVKSVLELASELYAIKFLFNDRIFIKRIIEKERERNLNISKQKTE